MERTLKLTQGARILELGCALGYHSIELTRRGYQVTGLDHSEAFLEVAQRRAKDASVSVNFIHGDMTHLRFTREFDAVVLWGNTFGLFSDQGNFQTLCGIAQALREGGLALIDTQNYSTLPEKLEKGWDFSREDEDLLFLGEGTRDVLNARFGFMVHAIDLTSGKRHTMPFSWRLYLLPELKRLVNDAGLSLLGIYGDDPEVVDWKSWERGQPQPYSVEGFTEKAGKRILLCQA
jgi:SAM-dependent methyltransferase